MYMSMSQTQSDCQRLAHPPTDAFAIRLLLTPITTTTHTHNHSTDNTRHTPTPKHPLLRCALSRLRLAAYRASRFYLLQNPQPPMPLRNAAHSHPAAQPRTPHSQPLGRLQHGTGCALRGVWWATARGGILLTRARSSCIKRILT
jgi:hypothetical protein